MGKLKSKVLYLMIGVLVGISYVVACGGSSSSGAASIGNAIDVVYDNVVSKLSGTNVQTAIDELAYKNPTAVTSDMLVGTWTGVQYSYRSLQTSLANIEVENTFTVTFNEDGSYVCAGIPDYNAEPVANQIHFPFPQEYCAWTSVTLDTWETTWQLRNGGLVLYRYDVYQGAPEASALQLGIVFPIDSTSFILNLGYTSVKFTKTS